VGFPLRRQGGDGGRVGGLAAATGVLVVDGPGGGEGRRGRCGGDGRRRGCRRAARRGGARSWPSRPPATPTCTRPPRPGWPSHCVLWWAMVLWPPRTPGPGEGVTVGPSLGPGTNRPSAASLLRWPASTRQPAAPGRNVRTIMHLVRHPLSTVLLVLVVLFFIFFF